MDGWNEVYIQSIASLNAELKETMDTYLNLESTPNIDAYIEHQLRTQEYQLMAPHKQYMLELYVESRLEDFDLFFKCLREDQYVPRPRNYDFSLLHSTPAGYSFGWNNHPKEVVIGAMVGMDRIMAVTIGMKGRPIIILVCLFWAVFV